MPEVSDELQHLYNERSKNLALQEQTAGSDRVDQLKKELAAIDAKIKAQKKKEGIE